MEELNSLSQELAMISESFIIREQKRSQCDTIGKF